jgi:pimeloyl-ACP methyl ester carboxylesterase
MIVDLVQATTRDGVRLDGALQMPSASAVATLPLDGVCLIHGTGGNFYSSTLFDAFAERFLALGCAVLRVNTRGHDGISTAVTVRGGKRQGAAYEAMDDCRHDLAAWVDWLRQRVGPRVALLGHSSGAVKCLYALSQEPQLPVACVVALSPPRLSYSAFCTVPEGREFLEEFSRAEQLVGAGEPATLLDVRLPLPYLITAAGYVEKYGPDERYNFLRFVSGVRCPLLVLFGSIEVEYNMAFRGAPEELERLAARHGRWQVEVIGGADHLYSGARQEVLSRVESWLRGL